jgi:multisubunit Na+/H+ antiporter MnhF subunit
VTGETLGRRSLALDAVYCAVAGLIAIVAFDPLAELLGAPEALLVAAGFATIVWALLVHRLARAADWRRPVVAVAAANVVAALGLAALALVTPRLAGQLLLAAVAIEVAAFAASQLVALRRAA